MANSVKYPFGPADTFACTATGTQAISIINQESIIDAATTQVTGNITINLTIDASVKSDAKIYFKVNTVGTQTVTFGTGFTCPTLTGVAGKTFTAGFYYDGTNFLPIAAPYQIN